MKSCFNDTFSSGNVVSDLSDYLRRYFYLSSPYKEMFQFPEEVPDYHNEAIPLFFACVLIEWAILWAKKIPGPTISDTATSVGMAVATEFVRILLRGMDHWLYMFIYHNLRLVDLPWDSAYTWYLSAIFADFCYYWAHRSTHEFNFLWAHHQAHHTAETVSLVNTFRLPLFHDWAFGFGFLPMAFFIPPSHYLVHVQLNLIFQFWLHTELVRKLGPFIEYVFSTPSHHRVHHGCVKYCIDKNYGGILIIWDRMFGTFQEELPDVPIVYGTVKPVHSSNPLYVQLHYFKEMYDKFNAQIGWKNKLFSVIKGPGWRPGSPWTGYADELPDIKPRPKYAPTAPWYWTAYILVHFVMSLFAFEVVSMFKDRLGPLAVFCHGVYIVGSMTIIGLFYDRNPAVPFLEFGRCLLTFMFSRRGIPLLSALLNRIGLEGFFAEFSLDDVILTLFRGWFLFSTLLWGFICLQIVFVKHIRAKLKVA